MTYNVFGGTLNPTLLVCFYQITRVENARLYGLFAMMRDHMVAVNGASVENERILWHGTAADTVKIICQHGFNCSYCGKNGTLLSFSVVCVTRSIL